MTVLASFHLFSFHLYAQRCGLYISIDVFEFVVTYMYSFVYAHPHTGSFSIYKYDVCPSTSVVIKGHPLYKVEAARNYTTSLGVVDCMRKADNNGISTWTWQDL